MTTTEDPRAKTAWPYLAAVLSVAAGTILAVVAYSQILSGDTVATLIGVWNAFVTLAYGLLAIRLVLRRAGAYLMGLYLSLGNVGLVLIQAWFWSKASSIADVVIGEDFVVVIVSFLASDLALSVAVFLSFRDLVPMLPYEVPDSSVLGPELETADVTDEEVSRLLSLRRDLISYASRKARGGIEINTTRGGVPIDLVVRPVSSHLRSFTGGEEPRRYAFHAIVDRNMVLRGKEHADFFVAVSATDDALDEANKGSSRIGIYLLRDRIRTSKRISELDELAEEELGLPFSYRRFTSSPPKDVVRDYVQAVAAGDCEQATAYKMPSKRQEGVLYCTPGHGPRLVNALIEGMVVQELDSDQDLDVILMGEFTFYEEERGKLTLEEHTVQVTQLNGQWFVAKVY